MIFTTLIQGAPRSVSWPGGGVGDGAFGHVTLAAGDSIAPAWPAGEDQMLSPPFVVDKIPSSYREFFARPQNPRELRLPKPPEAVLPRVTATPVAPAPGRATISREV